MRQAPAVWFLQLLICAWLGTPGFDPGLIISMAVKLICALFKNRQPQQTRKSLQTVSCRTFCFWHVLFHIPFSGLRGCAWILELSAGHCAQLFLLWHIVPTELLHHFDSLRTWTVSLLQEGLQLCLDFRCWWERRLTFCNRRTVFLSLSP